MLPPAPSVVVGAAIVKRFPGYGEHRGTIAEIDIDGGKVLVHWATDERTTLTLREAATRVVAVPPTEEQEEDDDQSVTSAAFGIESSATSFTEHSGALHAMAPRHVLLELDDEEDLRSINGDTTVTYDSDDETAPYLGEGGARTGSSRFWGVTWHQENNKWLAQYRDADGKMRCIGHYDDEEEAARAYNDAISDAGLEGRNKRKRRWEAQYADANGKVRSLGYFDTQEDAAHAVNAAIRALPPDVQRRRHTNPVVDGQLVPRVRRRKTKKRRRDEAAATPSTRPRLD